MFYRVNKKTSPVVLLSSSLYWRDSCKIPNENVSNWHYRKWQKTQKFRISKDFFQFFSKISMGFIDWNIEKVKNEKMLCTVGFLEELITVF